MNNGIRLIPSINELLSQDLWNEIKGKFNITNDLIKNQLQSVTHKVRHQMMDQRLQFKNREEIKDYILVNTQREIEKYFSPNLQPVINGTGTILHTNLGRARLSDQVIQRIIEIARHYSTLEFDLQSGKRGSRNDLVEKYIQDLTGAESAIVVNNNAAAVYFILKVFAKEREVIVSRGELVEIGGSFRVSSIMEESGAKLKEIGTTNKTHLYDYEDAITENTQMIMKVHTSNFHMVGFTKSVPRQELVELANNQNLIFYEDLGSGMMMNLEQQGIGREPRIRDVIESGVDIVSFSGDKLFGGLQAGIIAGKKKYIDLLKSHQLLRALRVDKLTYAALEETLKLWLTEQYSDIPTIREILLDPEEIHNRVNDFVDQIQPKLNKLTVQRISTSSVVGGGTLPDVKLPSYGISIKHKQFNAEQLSKILKDHSLPIISKIEKESIVLNFRTITKDEEEVILQKLLEIESDSSLNA